MVVLLTVMNQFILQPDQFGNAEKLEMAVLKIKRLLSEESFKKNAEILQLVAKMNSK
ncbi:17534_t:CDS:2 [Gigaspora margarita]|uniref:17534_t:CDS:1 n=1 Tax=Gigaspora margarita TaxID=4874 RepID=A0ABN7VME9_GIGMA|nr:17534_t:CDS:2 [Gigaspora margarita]